MDDFAPWFDFDSYDDGEEFEDNGCEVYGEPEEHDDGGEPYGELTPEEWYEKHWPSDKLYDYKPIVWG